MLPSKLTHKEMVQCLENPNLLLQKDNRPLELVQPVGKDLTLIKLLKEIDLAIQGERLSLAKQLFEIIIRLELEVTTDEQAWLSYHKGCLMIASGEWEAAETSLLDSLRCMEISWCHYKLGELYLKNVVHVSSSGRPVDLQIYYHFQRALETEPPLTQEAEAHLTNWLRDLFDPSLYSRLNPDLRHLNNSQLFQHFEQFGFSEGRISGKHGLEMALAKLSINLPDDFDWKRYLDCNSDLQDLLKNEHYSIYEAEYILSQHYMTYGKKEGRNYKPDSLSLDKIDERFYLRHKIYNNRILCKRLCDFLSSGRTLQIGDGKEVSITVILVLHNKASHTLECLKSLSSSARKDLHLIVVDNNSTDQTHDLLAKLEGNVSVITNKQNAHFLLACNEALKYVKSEYVCFLNNDAKLSEDTLDEAIACLYRYSNRAIVGGKVLHADGYIQDAGSIVFSDGSCSGLGRRYDPGYHLFNYERTVDYVSGAFFISTAQLVKKLNCFDIRFAPAYYEETDLCFRAAQLCIPVVYCPTAIIYHYEFASSIGTQWAVKQMANNQKLFCEVHSERLKYHLSAGIFSANNIENVMHGHIKEGPRVLFIDDQIPVQSSGSGFSRSKDILNHLSTFCGFITLYATDYERSRSNADTLPIGVECIEGDVQYLKRIIATRSSFYDFIIVSRKHNQEHFGDILNELNELGVNPEAKIIFDAESLFSIRDYTFKFLQETGQHLRSLGSLNLPILVAEELARFQIADAITCVSELELGLVKNMFPAKQCELVGHCFQQHEYDQEFCYEQRDSVIFLGAIYEELSPNHDSLEWLFNDLLPSLESLPTGMKKLIIAGNIRCEASLALIKSIQKGYPFVTYMGLIDDLDLLFSRARLFLAPTRYAAGVPHKVHLASSYGVPTLTTSLIAEQLGWSKLKSLFVFDTPDEFTHAIRVAFEDLDAFTQIRQSMLQVFNRDCDPAVFGGNLRSIVQPLSRN